MLNGKIIKEAITFDDVLLIPAKSEVLPSNVNLKTKLTKSLELNIPFLSAAMDTVTEAKLAIALARQGGIGFVHKNMSIEEQAAEIDKVKRNESGMITNPITLKKESILADAEHIMGTYKVSGLPVVDDDGTLVGIITNRDLKYRKNMDEKVVNDYVCLLFKPRFRRSLYRYWENRVGSLTVINHDKKYQHLCTCNTF